MIYLNNFFNSPKLVEKLFGRGVYCLCTVQSDRKNMAIMKKDKDMKRGDIDFQYVNNVLVVKWSDNSVVIMVGTFLEECSKVSTVIRRVKGQSAKIPVLCPEIIKGYNSGMDGVDLLHQKTAAYKLEHKSSDGRYYLRLFFDLMDVSVVNSHSIYKVLYPKEMELLDFKIVLANSLIGTYDIRSRNTWVSHVPRREVLPASVALHVLVLRTTSFNCRYCYTGGIENKTYIQCNTFGAFLCLISCNKSPNCFANFHTQV